MLVAVRRTSAPITPDTLAPSPSLPCCAVTHCACCSDPSQRCAQLQADPVPQPEPLGRPVLTFALADPRCWQVWSGSRRCSLNRLRRTAVLCVCGQPERGRRSEGLIFAWSCAQTERAFQRQLASNGGFKKPARKTPGKGGARYYKNVGLGFKTPKEAMEGAPPG